MLRGMTDRDALRDEATKCLRGYARMLYRFSNASSSVMANVYTLRAIAYWEGRLALERALRSAP